MKNYCFSLLKMTYKSNILAQILKTNKKIYRCNNELYVSISVYMFLLFLPGGQNMIKHLIKKKKSLQLLLYIMKFLSYKVIIDKVLRNYFWIE